MNGLRRLQDFLKNKNYDASILISETNLRYFTGFTGTTAVAFVTQNKAYLITDSRYRIQATNQCEGYTVIQYEDTVWATIKQLIETEALSIKICVIEGGYMPVDTYEKLSAVVSNIEQFKSEKFALLRAVKRDDELLLMRHAAKIADEAFAAMLPQLKVGMTENEARIILEKEMLLRGSEEVSFQTIVASGHRSNMPHGVASDKVIESGDFVTFDFGAVYKGYHSDMTRTIVMGKASDFQKYIYNVVLQSQLNGLKAVKAGISGKELDAACRQNFLDQEDLKDLIYQHGTGHGVGLDIHEEPVASIKSESTLEANMIVTIEPGIYLEGQYTIGGLTGGDCGLRIEDSVIVTDEGCEIITHTSKELIELEG
ncbi:Xaa-Pro peptidase family protein [uncultured Veillonella sp.]|uniref:M24 family metallopeptidase n=1 Tax=uncultured Veillonella sp. TaxID=159268 RepID=UPI002611A11A|nr:Xaa-Pro peptidase family protein [uncultured Veillonella sp.]